MGASGSGTTTLARALASQWAVPHADADDYFWVPTDPPYVEKRAEADRLRLMQEVFVPRGAWVLSGSVMGWGESLMTRVETVVFCTLPPAVRLERLRAREVVRYGARIEPGGDRGEEIARLGGQEIVDDRRRIDDRPVGMRLAVKDPHRIAVKPVAAVFAKV